MLNQCRNGTWNMSFAKRLDTASALRSAVLAAAIVPAAWMALDFATGQLGARPVDRAIREIGDWAIRLLLLSLAVTPLRQVFHWPRLAAVRRRIGVAAFCYVALHFTLYVADQKFDLAKVAGEIALRLYLTIGFTALLTLTALAVTSTDAMARRMGGRAWRRLHWLAYPAAVLGVVHFFLQAKLDNSEPMLMAGILGWLLLYRLIRRRSGEVTLPAVTVLGLAVGAAVIAAELAMFWFKFAAPPLRVLQAMLTFEAGWRPGIAVLAAGLAVALAAWIRSSRYPALRRA